MKLKKFTKIVFLVFGNNQRNNTLGNFGKSKIYNDILLISLGGRFKSIIGRILYFLGVGKFIGIDANPFFKNYKNSINIWFNGTQKIHIKKLSNYKNNFFNISNHIIDKNIKIFQLYPIIYKKKNFNKKPKIVFMGKIHFTPSEDLISSKFLHDNRENFLNKFNLVEDKNFWSFDNNEDQKINLIFKKYRIVKTYIRRQIIIMIQKKFKDNFLIYGDDRNKDKINFQNPLYDYEKVKKIYEGNICIDTGSIIGSKSLYPRSLNILESNGLLIQTKQYDFNEVWGNLNKKLIFNDIDSLLNCIDKLISNQKKFNEYLDLVYELFKNSHFKNYKLLKKTFY